jgi:histidinol-phosphatase (PHP family)
VKIDCHVHTDRCGHAVGTPDQYLAAARRAGVSVLAFTDHLSLPARLDPKREYSMCDAALPDYLEDIRTLAEQAEDVRVLVGIEADWLPDEMEQPAATLRAKRFDMVLGAVHFVDGWAFDDPALVGRYAEEDVDRLWRRYFELVADAARSGLFDVMAHVDLVKKFGFYPSFDPRELYEQVAAGLASAGVAIEVSTAGLRKPCAELYPNQALLQACARAGVPATIGSDAHAPVEVAAGYDVAREAMLAAGYASAVYFEARELREVTL